MNAVLRKTVQEAAVMIVSVPTDAVVTPGIVGVWSAISAWRNEFVNSWYCCL